MIRESASDKNVKVLCFMCCMAYFVSYLTRLDYAVCMVEIQNSLQVGKDMAGLPVTACFLSYGVGQIVFGFLGDRFSPPKMVFTGLFGSAVCNLLALCLPRMEVMIPVWCLNGVFQSMLWPPLVRIMAENMDEDWYRKACVRVSLSSSGATIALYLLAPIGIQISGWKAVFGLAAAGGILAALVWYKNTRQIGAERCRDSQGAGESGTAESDVSQDTLKADALGQDVLKKSRKALYIPFLLMIPAIVLHGTLKDGITTWMPVYMAEMFGMSSSKSILSAAVLPVCSVVSTLLASALLYRLKNEVLTAALFFAAAAFGGLAMIPAYDSHPVLCVMMMTLITGCMYGVNLMLISRVPGHFKAYGNVSAVSGLLNAATYVGSALSTYGFGTIAERAGWMPVVILWAMVALGGTLLLAFGVRRWARFT